MKEMLEERKDYEEGGEKYQEIYDARYEEGLNVCLYSLKIKD
jgi:hypothetical protein